MSIESTWRSIAAVVVIALAAACEPGGGPPDVPASQASADSARLNFRCDDEPEVDVNLVNAITGGGTFEHEAHDCQRLVVADGTRFGPLVGVFPLDQAMVPDFAGGPVASLLNFDADGLAEHAYPTFNLSSDEQDLWSCISLDPYHPTDSLTVATIFRLSSGSCAESTLREELIKLPVRISTHPRPGAVPPTARFMWDDAERVHYIGLRCGERWCSIHPPEITPSEPFRWNTLSTPREVVPRVLGTASTLRCGRGITLCPDPGRQSSRSAQLAAVSAAELNSSAAMVHVADIRFSMAPGNYVTKFNLKPDGSDWTSQVWVTLQGSGAAEFRSTGTTVSGYKDPTFGFVPMTHGAAGSVRWRWLTEDEGAWVYCASGCCSVGRQSVTRLTNPFAIWRAAG